MDCYILLQNQTLQATDVTLSGKQEQDTSNHPCRSKVRKIWYGTDR